MPGAQLLTRPLTVDPDRHRAAPPLADPNRRSARVFGGIFLAGGLAHLLLLSLDSSAYDSFADSSYWPFITHAWHSVLVPNVYYLVPLLAVFEAAVGAAILSRRYRMAGIAAAGTFNTALMLFGWGSAIWSVPVLALLARFALQETRTAHRAAGGDR